MSEYQASRTLVKSPPELWAECSDARSLARHLGDDVGEIRIRRLEPETTVAWEGERISGTVRLEPSGWGTKVTLTAAAADGAVERPERVHVQKPEPVQVETHEPVQVEEPQPVPVAPPEPAPSPAPEPSPRATPAAPAEQPPRNGFGARFRRWFAPAPSSAPDPVAVAQPAAEPVVVDPPAPEPVAVVARDPATDGQPVAPGPDRRTDPVDLTAALESLGKAHHRPFSRA